MRVGDQAENLSDSIWYELTDNNKKRMQRGRVPIGFDGEGVHLHHVQGKAKDMYDFVEMGASAHRSFHKTYGYGNFPDIRTILKM